MSFPLPKAPKNKPKHNSTKVHSGEANKFIGLFVQEFCTQQPH